MSLSITLVDLAGCIALLLWGTHMVQTGVQRAYSPNLRSILGSALRNRISAFFAGLGVTAALQSSTATGLIVSGFAAAGLVSLVPALAVMLGANVGTTLIVQVLSFNVVAFSPALILVGVFCFRRDTAPGSRSRRVFIGFGLMLLALHHLIEIMSPYENSPTMRQLLSLVSTAPLLDVILAAALTWAVHSSVAVVLLIMSMAAKGIVPLDAAFAFVLGANLGTAINPILEGASGNDPASRRVSVGNFLIRGFGFCWPWSPATDVAMDCRHRRKRSVWPSAIRFSAAGCLFFPPSAPREVTVVDVAQPCRPGRRVPFARPIGPGPIVALGGARGPSPSCGRD
jgi:phosphate:Na+ symporter